MISVAVALVAMVAVAVLALRPPPTPRYATVLPTPLSLPEISLRDGAGNEFTADTLSNHISLLFFGFTQCPDVCPLTLAQLAEFRRELVAQGSPDLPNIVFISVDPERDTVERVGAYTSAFGEGVLGVRGELEEIDKLAGTLGAFHARPVTAEGYSVEHSAGVFVIGPGAQFRAVYSAPHDVEEWIDDWPGLVASLSTRK